MQPNLLIKAAIIHIANQANHNARYGAKLKRMGLRAGASDFFLPIPRSGYPGFFIEMKRNKKYTKSEMSTESWLRQEMFQATMRALDYKAEFAYGANQAIEMVKEYMKWLN